jgi:hypothetical protein
VVGSPSQPVKAFFRQVAILRRMDRERSSGKARSARGAAEDEAGTD